MTQYPRPPQVRWGDKDIKGATAKLKLHYPDAQFSVEDLQAMVNLLKEEYGNDALQIEKTILTHMRKIYPVIYKHI